MSPNRCAAEFNDVLHSSIGTQDVVPLFRAFMGSGKPNSYDKFLVRDGLHPNKVGSELIVALISKFIFQHSGSKRFGDKRLHFEPKIRKPTGFRLQESDEDANLRRTRRSMLVLDSPPPNVKDLIEYPNLSEECCSTMPTLTGYTQAAKKPATVHKQQPPLPRSKTQCGFFLAFSFQ